MPRVATTVARFREVNPQRSDPAFRRYVKSGLRVLAASDVPEAKRTLRAIVSGRVKVDLFSDLTSADYRHVRRDLPGLLGPKLDARMFTKMSNAIDGYSFSDRVYVHRDLSPRQLASTLVHEVTHVLMNTDQNYQGPKAVLRQEYASFYAEKRFRGVEMTPQRSRALKQYVIKLYELKGVTPDDVPDRPQLPARARSRVAAATQ